MAVGRKRDRVRGDGFVDARERAQIVEAVALARGRPAESAEVDAVVDWLSGARLACMMAEGVLDGSYVVKIEAGAPVFRTRTPPATRVQ